MRTAVRDVRRSHDAIPQLSSSRCLSLGKRLWAKKSEVSTGAMSSFNRMNDSTLLDRTPSQATVNEEMTEFRSVALLLQRLTRRIASRTARLWSASRNVTLKVPSWSPTPPSTRSSGAVPEWRCQRAQLAGVLPQKLQTSGVCKATSNQWWQTNRKLRDPFSNPSKMSLRETFHRKILPSTSGGSLETFSSEFRARLSLIMALSCSLICSSRARMDSMFVSPLSLFSIGSGCGMHPGRVGLRWQGYFFET